MKKTLILVLFVLISSTILLSCTEAMALEPKEEMMENLGIYLGMFITNPIEDEEQYIGEKTVDEIRNESYIGNEIMVYEIVDDTIQKATNVRIFPVFCNGDIINTYFMMYKNKKFQSSILTTDYAKNLNEYLKANESDYILVLIEEMSFFVLKDESIVFDMTLPGDYSDEYIDSKKAKILSVLKANATTQIKTTESLHPVEKITVIEN